MSTEKFATFFALKKRCDGGHSELKLPLSDLRDNFHAHTVFMFKNKSPETTLHGVDGELGGEGEDVDTSSPKGEQSWRT